MSSNSTVPLQERETFLLDHDRCGGRDVLGLRHRSLVVSEVFALRLLFLIRHLVDSTIGMHLKDRCISNCC